MELIKAERIHIQDLTRISKDAFDSDITVGAEEVGGPPEYDSLEWHLEMWKAGSLFTALEEGRVIGGAVVFSDKSHSGQMHVGRIFVDPKEFGRGLGIQIMEQLEKGFPAISVWTLDTPIWNKRTNRFYRKLGYTESHRDQEFVYYRKEKTAYNFMKS